MADVSSGVAYPQLKPLPCVASSLALHESEAREHVGQLVGVVAYLAHDGTLGGGPLANVDAVGHGVVDDEVALTFFGGVLFDMALAFLYQSIVSILC